MGVVLGCRPNRLVPIYPSCISDKSNWIRKKLVNFVAVIYDWCWLTNFGNMKFILSTFLLYCASFSKYSSAQSYLVIDFAYHKSQLCVGRRRNSKNNQFKIRSHSGAHSSSQSPHYVRLKAYDEWARTSSKFWKTPIYLTKTTFRFTRTSTMCAKWHVFHLKSK